MQVSLSLTSGTTLSDGRYTIEKELDSGGFGITYLAHSNLGSLYGESLVIKEFFLNGCFRDDDNSVTLTNRVGTDGFEDALRKFREETDKIFALREHSGIVNVEDKFNDNATSYYVMEFVKKPTEFDEIGGELKGMTFKDFLKARPLSNKEEILDVLYYLWQIADALTFSHSRNVYHLDVKPSNFLVADEQYEIQLSHSESHSQYRLKLIDFGSAKIVQNDGGVTTTMTGTKGFTAPEIEEGEFVSNASLDSSLLSKPDIYSLGASLMSCFSPKIPVGKQAIRKKLKASSVPVPKEVENLIIRCMEYDPGKRYATMVDLQEAIEKVITSLSSPLNQPIEEPLTILIDPKPQVERKPETRVPQTLDKQPALQSKPEVGSPAKKKGRTGLWVVLSLLLICSAFAIWRFTGDGNIESQLTTEQKEQIDSLISTANYSTGETEANKLLETANASDTNWLEARLQFCQLMKEGDESHDQRDCDTALSKYGKAKSLSIYEDLVDKQVKLVELTKNLNGCN